jgi:hypothetical protein
MLSRAAGWVGLLGEMTDHRFKLLGEFWNDDDPQELAWEQIVEAVRKANWIANKFGPIPETHWTAARQWREALAPHILIARGERIT